MSGFWERCATSPVSSPGAKFFVLSSISEGVSLTLLEAMARSLPVVATAVGGNPEVVDDGVTGLLVPSRDPERLASAMLRLHQDSDERARMGGAARQRVERHFDIRGMVGRYETLYQAGRLAKKTPVITLSPTLREPS